MLQSLLWMRTWTLELPETSRTQAIKLKCLVQWSCDSPQLASGWKSEAVKKTYTERKANVWWSKSYINVKVLFHPSEDKSARHFHSQCLQLFWRETELSCCSHCDSGTPEFKPDPEDVLYPGKVLPSKEIILGIQHHCSVRNLERSRGIL